MKPTTFEPGWPRVFLETELMRGLSALPVNRGRCLNVGCGVEGRYAELLTAFDIDGVDIAHPGDQPMPWRHHQCDARRLPFAASTFDLAVAIESFEHIDDNVAAMREVARTLKPGGWLVVTTPTHWTWLFEFGRHGPHYYDRKALETLIREAGIEVRRSLACGGALYWLANLVKSWLSPIGLRLLGKRWWAIIDGALHPVFRLAWWLDRVLPFLPSNWLVVGMKAEKALQEFGK